MSYEILDITAEEVNAIRALVRYRKTLAPHLKEKLLNSLGIKARAVADRYEKNPPPPQRWRRRAN